MITTHLSSQMILYDQDYQLWLETAIEQIKSKKLERVDWENLLKELENLVSSNRREIKSRLRLLLMHLLKYKYQPKKRSSSWVSTILDQYDQIKDLLEESPSLKPYYLEIFADCYNKAVHNASDETRLPVKSFPTESPFLPQDVIDRDFISSLIIEEKV